MARNKRISYELVEGYISTSFSERSSSSEIKARIVRELMCGGLTQKQREYLILRYLKKMNGAEIARMYGVSRAAVSITLSRARQRIIKLLGTQKLREDFNDYLSEL